MRVIRVTNERARLLIEAFTAEYCKPHQIKFVQDGNGDFVMSPENLDNPVYLNPNTEALEEFLAQNEVTESIGSIADIMRLYGEEIEYVPIQ